MMCGTVGRCGNQNMCVSPTTLSCCRIPDRRTHLVRVDLNRRHPLMVATWVDFNCHTCWNCIWLSRLPLNRIAVRKDSSQMGDATYIPDDLKTIDKSVRIQCPTQRLTRLGNYACLTEMYHQISDAGFPNLTLIIFSFP